MLLFLYAVSIHFESDFCPVLGLKTVPFSSPNWSFFVQQSLFKKSRFFDRFWVPFSMDFSSLLKVKNEEK